FADAAHDDREAAVLDGVGLDLAAPEADEAVTPERLVVVVANPARRDFIGRDVAEQRPFGIPFEVLARELRLEQRRVFGEKQDPPLEGDRARARHHTSITIAGQSFHVHMRIALVTTSWPAHEGDPSGHFVQAEARELERAGHEVLVVTPEPGGAFGWPGVSSRVRERPWRAIDALRWVRGPRAQVAGLRVDRVVAHWAVPCAWPIGVAAPGAEL